MFSVMNNIQRCKIKITEYSKFWVSHLLKKPVTRVFLNYLTGCEATGPKK